MSVGYVWDMCVCVCAGNPTKTTRCVFKSKGQSIGPGVYEVFAHIKLQTLTLLPSVFTYAVLVPHTYVRT